MISTSGMSTKTIIHYGQLVLSGKFRQFDYESKNINVYNQSEPLDYNLTNIRIPISLFWSSDDWLSTPSVSHALLKS